MLSELEVERRLRAVDAQTQQAASQRRYYDAVSLSQPSDDRADTSLAADRGHHVKFASGIDSDVPRAGGAGAGAPQLSCARCQALDVSLGILRSNVASVEEGYLSQIDQLNELVATLEAEREKLINQANMSLHDAELQRSNSLKRNGEIASLRREVTRLEVECDALRRGAEQSEGTLAAVQRFSAERDRLQLLQEEAVARNELVVLRNAAWDVALAVLHAQRLAEYKIEQHTSKLELRHRLGSSVPVAPREGPELSSSTGDLVAALSAVPYSGTDAAAAAVRVELQRLDSNLNESLAKELRLTASLTAAQQQRSALEERCRVLHRAALEAEEQSIRSSLESVTLSGLVSLGPKFAAGFLQAADSVSEQQKKAGAAKEKELTTLRKLMMDAKEEGFALKKQVAWLEAEKGALQEKLAKAQAALDAKSGDRQLTEIGVQTMLAGTDLFAQLRAYCAGSLPEFGSQLLQPKGIGRRASSLHTATPPVEKSPSIEGLPASGVSDAPSPAMHLDHPTAGGDELHPPSEHVLGSVLEVLRALQDQVGRIEEHGRVLKAELSQKPKPDDSVQVAKEPGGTPTPQTHAHLDEHLVQVKFALRNLLVCVGQHQKTVHQSVLEVSKSLTAVQTGMDRIEGGQTTLRSEVKQLDQHLQKAVERQMLIDRLAASPPAALLGQLPSATATSGTASPTSPGAKVGTTAQPPPNAAATKQPAPKPKAPAHHWDEDDDESDDPIVVPSHPSMKAARGPGPKPAANKTPYDDASDSG